MSQHASSGKTYLTDFYKLQRISKEQLFQVAVTLLARWDYSSIFSLASTLVLQAKELCCNLGRSVS